jgi:hypothetical protein
VDEAQVGARRRLIVHRDGALENCRRVVEPPRKSVHASEGRERAGVVASCAVDGALEHRDCGVGVAELRENGAVLHEIWRVMWRRAQEGLEDWQRLIRLSSLHSEARQSFPREGVGWIDCQSIAVQLLRLADAHGVALDDCGRVSIRSDVARSPRDGLAVQVLRICEGGAASRGDRGFGECEHADRDGERSEPSFQAGAQRKVRDADDDCRHYRGKREIESALCRHFCGDGHEARRGRENNEDASAEESEPDPSVTPPGEEGERSE